MDPKIAKKTQSTLGKVISKPPLTDKLLGKPPFRFLHDVTTSVIKTTGFMKGLFTDFELNSENVKEKDNKVAFLQKSIDMVCLVTGKSLSVRPQKIVAGHEPDKTNEFLQVLAEAINMKVDNDEYVKRLLKGKGGGAEKKDKEKESRSRSADKRKKESEEKKDKGPEGREKTRDREKSRDKEKSREEGKDREKSRDRDKDRSRDRDKDRDHRRKKHELRQDGSGQSEESDKESQDEGMIQQLTEGRVKTKRRRSKTKHEESTSTDEKHRESTKANVNARSRADRPRGARRRSERQMPVMKPGDESSDDESANGVSFLSYEVDKKRKTGIKSRLGVRSEKGSVSPDHGAEEQEGEPWNDRHSASRDSVDSPNRTMQMENTRSCKTLSRSTSKSGTNTPKQDKASSSRRQSTETKDKDSPMHPKTPGDARSRRRASQATPDKRRKSSFTMMPHLMNGSQVNAVTLLCSLEMFTIP
ncbi:TRAF3-interacting protein 1-like isoform X5 [Haliotis rubra]|uniref:TRAF3-interacting protein 1-like isoform X5 n=1 Tax=Haliotis rubra TaxID=36100 RepID=UPI001EE61A54|nr:TRAF3-interacting protein 1-like isoform X5 [Haliotis rubra]